MSDTPKKHNPLQRYHEELFESHSDLTLREKSRRAKITDSGLPRTVYIALGITLAVIFIVKIFNADLFLNIISEFIGAVFILFVIDQIIGKDKIKRWHLVHENIDYLIGRTINRIRDGVATRVFDFKPEFDEALSEAYIVEEIRSQRERFLDSVKRNSELELAAILDKEVFSSDNYDYFNEKAQDVWKLINMKYAEYFDPKLVHLLMELHTNLCDSCAYIRSYGKAELFPDDSEYYIRSSKSGLARHMKEIVRIITTLKDEGYSDIAKA